MDIKVIIMKTIVLIIVCLLSLSDIKAQGLKKKKANIDKSEIFQTLTDVVICKCIDNSFPLDSLSFKDPSVYVLLENINGSYEIISLVDSFTIKYIRETNIPRPGMNKENTKKERFMANCMKLRRTKVLLNFVNKLYSSFFVDTYKK